MPKEIVSIRLNESEVEYLKELAEQGYNKSAIIRKGLALYKRVNERLQERQTRRLNDK